MAASKRLVTYAFVLAVMASLAPHLGAQGGATTGAIIGTVTDNTKAVMPGVTITVSGPALMGARTVVTAADGAYRIPALSPGEYKLVFELPGFGPVTREGILIRVGFTATIPVEMSPAAVAESVTVSGASPVVDLSATKVTTDYSAEKMENALGSRDYAALFSLVPGVTISNPDVAGSGAISNQGYTAYGIYGQNRGLMEGIVANYSGEGGRELFYTDFNQFEDMSVNVVGNTAEMPGSGTLTVLVAKSGGNIYHGHLYQDFQNASMEAHNIDASQLALGVSGGGKVAATDLNRMVLFRDFNGDLGGFILKDKLWWYAAYQKTKLTQNFPSLIDNSQISGLGSRTGKLNFSLTQNNKFIAYYTRGTKTQNVHTQSDSSQFVSGDALQSQIWPNGVWKGEYNAVLGKAAVVELRGGNYYDEGIYAGFGDTLRYQDVGNNRLIGNAGSSHSFHDRHQGNGSLTAFKRGWAGSHDFKFGAEVMKETNSGTTRPFNNLLMILSNGAPSQVQLYLPPTTTQRAMSEFGAYAQDSWRLNSRATLNLGLRFDHYRSYVPAQVGASGQPFGEITAPLWNNPAIRLGIVYGLTSDGKTLVKANYGQYWRSPYTDLSALFNPNPASSYSKYTWTPANPTYLNGLPVYQPGEEGRLLSVAGANPSGQPSVTVDPNLQNTYSRQALVYFEREVAANFGMRTGFVWNAWRQGYGEINTNAPFSAFNVPVTVTDPGPDGKPGTADDGGTVQAFNLSPAYLGLSPVQVMQNLPYMNNDFYTWEITANKRQAGRWSLVTGFSKTWTHQSAIPVGYTVGNTSTALFQPNTFINTVDGQQVYSNWTVKVGSTVDAGKGVRVTANVKSQPGSPFVRTFNANLNFSTAVVIKSEPYGTETLPGITLVDLRVEKNLGIARTKAGVFLDAYNIFNINASQALTASSGSNFMRPSNITPPRVFRIGAKLNF